MDTALHARCRPQIQQLLSDIWCLVVQKQDVPKNEKNDDFQCQASLEPAPVWFLQGHSSTVTLQGGHVLDFIFSSIIMLCGVRLCRLEEDHGLPGAILAMGLRVCPAQHHFCEAHR